MNYFEQLQKSTNETIFMFVTVTIIVIIVMNRLKANTSVLVALLLSYFFIIYSLQKNDIKDKFENNQHEVKYKNVYPQHKKLHKYEEIIDFLFTIQDMYKYNPPAYEEMVDNIRSFFVVYENNKINSDLCQQNYDIMTNKKENALNALHSIIFNLSDDNIIINKLTESYYTLEIILNRYISDTIKHCNDIIIKHGYNAKRKMIYNGPDAYNKYQTMGNHSYNFF